MDKIKHYHIEEKIGSGGMGLVYKAFDTVLERHVAIKVMHQHLLDDKQNADRFMNEARAAAKLTNPSIVTIFEIGDDESGRYIVMEYVEGKPLSNFIITDAALAVPRTLHLQRQILEALATAHDHGVLHRDIKPENVLVTKDDVVKILDFGIARINAGQGLTMAGDVLGTIEYMAPEQMMGDVIDARADLYSAGVLLYNMLTGHLPFTGDSAVTILYKQLNEPPVPPGFYNKAIPAPLENVVMRGLSKSPDERWQTAAEFAAALELQALESETIEVVSSSPVEPPDSTDASLEPGAALSDEVRAFVGRKDENVLLVDLFRNVSAGEGQTAILMGEAGVGKSTLAENFQVFARQQKAIVLYGACLYQDGMDAYLPYIDAMRKFFTTDIKRLPQNVQVQLKSLIRERVPLLMEFTERLNTSFSGKGNASGENVALNGADMFEGIHLLISLIGQIHPVVLILDDLQWADDASLKLFHYLARQITRNRVMLIGISRSDRYDLQHNGKPTLIVDVLARMRREDLYTHISIERLKREICDRLIDETLGQTIFSEAFYARMYQETKGNPFFIIETLKFLQDTEKIYLKNETWHDKPDELQQISVPGRVEDIFARRLNALSDDEREIMQIAAIIGYKFDASILAKILETPKLKLLKTLQSIDRDLNILIGTEDGFQFEHPMLREMLYSEVPAALRREYHAMTAEEMDARYAPKYGSLIGEVSYHYNRSGNVVKALPLLYKAASRAFKINAYAEACTYYEEVIDSLGKLDDERTSGIPRAELLLRLAICYEETSRWALSLRTYEQLLHYSESQVDPQGQVDALRRMGRVHEKLSEYDQAIGYLERCLTIVEMHDLPNSVSRIYNSLGVIHINNGNYEVALEYFHSTMEVNDHPFVRYDHAHALTNIGIIHNIRSEHEEALQFYHRALAIYEDLGDKNGTARIYHNLGMTFTDLADWQAAIENFESCYQLSQDAGDSQLRALTLLNIGKAYARQEMSSRAEEYVQKALKIFRRSGELLNLAECYLVLGIIERTRRAYDDAERYFLESVKINLRRNHLEGAADGYFELALLSKEQGDVAAAGDRFEEAAIQYEKIELPEKAAEARACISTTQEQQAESPSVKQVDAKNLSKKTNDETVRN